MPANTENFALQTDLSVNPYYDDYNASKQFYRILFRPSVAVQARELTQLQTILQKQIDRFGEHVFKEGSLVSGGAFNTDSLYHFVRIKDLNPSSATVNVQNFVDKSITGGTTGVKAIVVNVVDGAEATAPDLKTLYIKYTSSGTDTTTKVFSANETLTANSGATAVVANTGIGYAFTIDPGVVFAKDHFISFDKQTIIVSKYSDVPTLKVGFEIVESIVTDSGDVSLLEPASGARNYAAPGAHRLKLSPVLVTRPVDTTDKNFVELFEIKAGVVQNKYENPQYSIIRDELARRTYDESGNYVVYGLQTRLREHSKAADTSGLYSTAEGGNTNFIVAGVSPGKAYVMGYDVETLVTKYLPIKKGLDYKNVEQQTVSANYGNFIYVDDVAGLADVNIHAQVTIYDTAQNAISGLRYGASPNGSIIGYANVRAIVYESGTKGTAAGRYRLYLYNIKMTAGEFSAARSFYINNATASDFYADAVLDGGIAILNETAFNRALFKIAAKNIRKIRDYQDNVDTTFTFLKKYDVTIATDGTFSVTTGLADEIFPYAVGALNSTQKSDFYVVLNGAATVSQTGTVNATSGNTTITGIGTTFSTAFVAGEKIRIGSDTYIISAITSNTALTLTAAAATTASNSAFTKAFYAGDVVDFGVLNRSISLASASTADFDMESLSTSVNASVICNINKIDGREIKKTIRRNRLVQINCATNSATNVGPWNLGLADVFRLVSVRKKNSAFTATSEGTDVTSYFTLDNGQRDNFYDHARLKLTGSLSIASGDYLLITVDYFAHDTSQGVGYYSVDSYPIDNVNGTANTNAIQTKEIPVYVSPITGVTYSLRDCIDIRSRKDNTATDTTVIGTVSTNPATTDTFTVPTGGIHTSTPNENFVLDLSYYLGRKDLIIMDEIGAFKAVMGTPSAKPITPATPQNTMAVAVIDIAPFPSLPPSVATAADREEYACKVKQLSFRRYTMRDIGVLDKRIQNLEYYTTLTFLEKDTLDLKILDSDGLDRFKNGILVDPFADHSIGDFTSPDYACSIDRKQTELRPKFKIKNVKFKYSNTSTNVTKTSNIVTLPYTHAELIAQKAATSSRNLAGLYYKFVGSMTLDPANDYWTDTDQAPEKTVSVGTTAEQWQQLADAWGTDWSNWETYWSGTSTSEDTTQSSSTSTSGDTTTSTSTTSTATTTTTYDYQSRTGTSVSVTTSTNEQSLGNFVVDVSMTPYMRSINIKVTVIGLKSSSRFYVTFDGEKVDAYVTQTDASFVATKDEGESLVSDSSGNLYFTFRIPNDDSLKFTTGSKVLRVADNQTKGNETSSAEETFTAYGLTQTKQETIISTEEPTFSTNTVSETRVITDSSTSTSTTTTTDTTTTTVSDPDDTSDGGGMPAGDADGGDDGGWTEVTGSEGGGMDRNGDGIGDTYHDPIGQTFMIDLGKGQTGCFVTKLDLWFKTKDAGYGVRAELRPVDANGIITKYVIPGSVVHLPPASINISEDASVVTTVTFKYPVFLLNGYEYAFVLLPIANNPNTEIWTAKLGEEDLTTGKRISEQPYFGVLVASSNNSTWEPIQDEDIKFVLHRAVFDTSVSGAVYFNNDETDFISVANTTGPVRVGEKVNGEARLTLTSITGGTIIVGNTLTGGTSAATGVVRKIDGSVYYLKDVTGTFVAAETVTSGAISATVSAVSRPQAEVFYYNGDDSNNIKLEIKNLADTANKFEAGEQLKSATSNNTLYISTLDNVPFNVADIEISKLDYSEARSYWKAKTTSTSDVLDSTFEYFNVNTNTFFETERRVKSQSAESGKSLQVKGTLKSLNDYLSPVVNTERSYAVLVHNIINNDATNENKASGGNAIARYQTNNVVLAEDQDAEDLKAYITAYRPSGADIKLYYKILHAEDADLLADVEWKEMSMLSKNVFSDTQNKDDFKEYEFNIPTSELTGAAAEVQYVNSAGVTFTGFKYFKIKVVMLSNNTSSVPRLKDLRAIALQK